MRTRRRLLDKVESPDARRPQRQAVPYTRAVREEDLTLCHLLHTWRRQVHRRRIQLSRGHRAPALCGRYIGTAVGGQEPIFEARSGEMMVAVLTTGGRWTCAEPHVD